MEEVVKRNGDAKFQKEKIIEKFDLQKNTRTFPQQMNLSFAHHVSCKCRN